jgi:transposase
MAISLPDARHLSDDILEALRLRALRGRELGFSEADIADLLGVARETVSRWWSAFSAGGTDALPRRRTGRPLGSGRTLSDEQADHLQQLIDANTPQELGIASPLWTRPAVRDLIRDEYGIDMPVRTVGEYLARWGYTSKVPRRHAGRQDAEEVREWLEETYPAIEERAEREGAEILWCDETGVAADEHPGRGYARQGEPAVMEVPDPHIRVNVISAVGNAGEVHSMTYTRSMDGALFITFLEQLVRESGGRKVFLIADRLKAHGSAPVSEWLASHADAIEVFELPRRSPELNPDEYLNNDLKGNVHGAGLPEDKKELRSRVQVFLDELAHLPDRIRSYFQHPCVQYAAGS